MMAHMLRTLPPMQEAQTVFWVPRCCRHLQNEPAGLFESATHQTPQLSSRRKQIMIFLALSDQNSDEHLD